jgi:hypothetical protein
MQRVGVLFTVLLSGCSFVLVSGPPSNHQQLPSFECTTSRLGPGLDTVWTVLQTLNFVTTLARTEQEWNDQFTGEPPFARSTALPLYAVMAGLGAAGMYYGFSRTGQCRSAKAELNNRITQPGGTGTQPAPGTWPPPGQPTPQGGTWPPPGQPAPQGGTWPPPGPQSGQPYPTQPPTNTAEPQPYPTP